MSVWVWENRKALHVLRPNAPVFPHASCMGAVSATYGSPVAGIGGSDECLTCWGSATLNVSHACAHGTASHCLLPTLLALSCWLQGSEQLTQWLMNKYSKRAVKKLHSFCSLASGMFGGTFWDKDHHPPVEQCQRMCPYMTPTPPALCLARHTGSLSPRGQSQVLARLGTVTV